MLPICGFFDRKVCKNSYFAIEVTSHSKPDIRYLLYNSTPARRLTCRAVVLVTYMLASSTDVSDNPLLIREPLLIMERFRGLCAPVMEGCLCCEGGGGNIISIVMFLGYALGDVVYYKLHVCHGYSLCVARVLNNSYWSYSRTQTSSTKKSRSEKIPSQDNAI